MAAENLRPGRSLTAATLGNIQRMTAPTRIKQLVLASLLSLFCALAPAADWQSFSGRVVAIVDGDTVDVLTPERRVRRVRLMGIDAPERKQAFGSRATQQLAALAFGRDVTVQWRHFDSRGKREVGQVFVAGQDVNLEMLVSGFAWWEHTYQREQLPADRVRYSEAEKAARAARTGLWTDPDPIPPWDWRRQQKEKAAVRRMGAAPHAR